MELYLLIAAPLGVALLVALTWALGGWRTAMLTGEAAAVARYLDDDPLFAPGEVLLASDGRAALIAETGGTDVAVVAALGDKLITRRLGHGMLRQAQMRVRKHPELVLRLADHTCPVIVLDVSGIDEPLRQTWLFRLAGISPAPDRQAA